jgi:hypothetical protein
MNERINKREGEEDNISVWHAVSRYPPPEHPIIKETGRSNVLDVRSFAAISWESARLKKKI